MCYCIVLYCIVKPGAMPGFSFIDHIYPDLTPIVHGQKVQQAQPGVGRAAYSAKRAVNYIPESHCWCVAFQGPLTSQRELGKECFGSVFAQCVMEKCLAPFTCTNCALLQWVHNKCGDYTNKETETYPRASLSMQ